MAHLMPQNNIKWTKKMKVGFGMLHISKSAFPCIKSSIIFNDEINVLALYHWIFQTSIQGRTEIVTLRMLCLEAEESLSQMEASNRFPRGLWMCSQLFCRAGARVYMARRLSSGRAIWKVCLGLPCLLHPQNYLCIWSWYQNYFCWL